MSIFKGLRDSSMNAYQAEVRPQKKLSIGYGHQVSTERSS